MNFNRGDIAYHKIIGKVVILGEITENDEIFIKVRTDKGTIEKFYPEELESVETVIARARTKADEVNRMNEENAKKIREMW